MPEMSSDKKSLTLDQRIKNPCFDEATLSQKCVNQNKTNKDENCRDYFMNYKMCMKFWTKVQRDRRRRGIKPLLPDIEDRPRVIEEYKHLLNEDKKEP